MAAGGPARLSLTFTVATDPWTGSSPKPRGDLDTSIGSEDATEDMPVTFGKVLSMNVGSPGSYLMPATPSGMSTRGQDSIPLRPRAIESLLQMPTAGRARDSTATTGPRPRDSMASGREGQPPEGDGRNAMESEDRVAELTELAYTMDKQCTDMCTSISSNRSSFNVTWSPSRMRPKQSNATASMSLKSMELEDPTLLRATTLVQVLAGWGRHLKTIGGGPREYSNMIFSMSQPTDEIDYFVSHCWRDTRLPKLLALWIHSNIGGAICLSLVVALILAGLVSNKVIPSQPVSEGLNAERGLPWCLFFGCLTFMVCLSCWHQILASCGFRRTYFVDKFCVHQGDPDLKRRGVASFAAFIGKSQRMLLLWSPQYFTRLWCTLEVAALVRASSGVHGKPEGPLPLDFFPLQLASVSCMAWLLQFLSFLAVDIYRMFNPSRTATVVVTAVLAFLASIILMRSLKAYSRSRLALADQLQNFSIQEAECARLEDRHKVQERVLKWFENLDTCNQHIREKVKDQVLAVLGPSQHYPTRMILPVILINIFDEADYVSSGLHPARGPGAWFSALGWSCFVGTSVPVCYRMCHYLFYKQFGTAWIECLATIFAGLMASLYMTFGFFLYTRSYNGDFDLWLIITVSVVWLVLLLWLQRADWLPLFSF